MKIKICCISNLEEANLAIQHGAHAIGLVGPMPSGPGVIDDALIAEIAAATPPHTQTFLLTSETDTEAIIDHHRRTKTTTIQLVDEIRKGQYSDLRKALPDVKLVQVIHVIDESSIQQALKAATEVDYLLLDSGNPAAAKKELGGTGRTHNWEISKTIVEKSPVPVFLAGGLKPENVRAAILQVGPFGLDLCSGVRREGALNEVKLKAFFKHVEKAIDLQD